MATKKRSKKRAKKASSCPCPKGTITSGKACYRRRKGGKKGKRVAHKKC